MNLLEKLDKIVEKYRSGLRRVIKERQEEMAKNKMEHLEIYRIFGYEDEEGRKIDLYQNIGRFFYRYAGSLLEDLTKTTLTEYKNAKRIKIPNTVSSSPREFEIDSFTQADKKAHDIKWRNATTDGDHVRKEHEKLKSIVDNKLVPVRIMFYMPEREQACKIQEKLIKAYKKNGEAYVGENAWKYINRYTRFDLKSYMLKKMFESTKIK